VESLSLPALIVAQTGYGKKAVLQLLQGVLATRGTPSIIVSQRDCLREQERTAFVDLDACVEQKLRETTHCSPQDAKLWLSDRGRYAVLFDAIDDSGSQERVYSLIRQLWQAQQEGISIAISAQPQNLNYVLSRYGFEPWMIWLRDQIPTVDVRGIDVHDVQRIAADYKEHRVPLEDVRTVLRFPQQCVQSKPVVDEWVAQPKLFREHGAKSVTRVATAMRAVGPTCENWRRDVLGAMLRARVWSYCHDQLCDWQVEGDKYLEAARQLRELDTVDGAQLDLLAKRQGFARADELAFPLLSIGVLYFEAATLKVDAQWIPE
jgi:energy-coupling factor transporter ATP-binding protein EcfA2